MPDADTWRKGAARGIPRLFSILNGSAAALPCSVWNSAPCWFEPFSPSTRQTHIGRPTVTKSRETETSDVHHRRSRHHRSHRHNRHADRDDHAGSPRRPEPGSRKRQRIHDGCRLAASQPASPRPVNHSGRRRPRLTPERLHSQSRFCPGAFASRFFHDASSRVPPARPRAALGWLSPRSQPFFLRCHASSCDLRKLHHGGSRIC